MTGVVESRKEDTALKRKLLWQNLKSGSWNVRTLRQMAKLKELCNEAFRYRLDIVRVQEVRWRGQGKRRTCGGMAIIYSGRVTYRQSQLWNHPNYYRCLLRTNCL